MSHRIYLASPHMSQEGYELDYIKEAFESNWIAPAGPHLKAFEDEMCAYTGAKHAVALNSGAAALHFALKLSGVGPGDIVFCQTLTYVATANAILYEKATPVFIDSDEESWNLCPELLEEAFKKYPKVKAVMVVHIYGMAAKMDEIRAICKKYNTPLIEDAAESLGTYYKGQHTGTLSDYGILSFNGNKIITTSTGGMLLSEDKVGLERALKWSIQGKEDAPYFEHHEVGYTYRLSNVLAGLGRGQLKVLEQRRQKKKYMFNYYKEAFKKYENISFMPMNDWQDSNCWLTCIQLKDGTLPMKIKGALEDENIESRLAWKPMHLQKVFEGCDIIGGEVSERLFEHGICLPSDTKLTDVELDRIISIVKKVIEA
jgi:dTDP-4-amino-4,6-dideoxygalactose transaminase